MKKYLVIAILFIMSISNILPFQLAFAQSEIKVKFNDSELLFDAKPYVKDGRTLVPFRKILEAFGAEVSWDAGKEVVSAKKKTDEIYLKLGVDYAYVNGSKVSLDVAPEVANGRTFVPLRFIGENLGAEVNWDNSTGTVSITYNDAAYKVGQEGIYKDLKFSINKIDTSSEPGVLKLSGQVNFDTKGIVLEVADDLGYVLPAEIVTSSKLGDINNFEGKVSLPTCHNFIGKYLIIKKPNSANKLVKIAEYDL